MPKNKKNSQSSSRKSVVISEESVQHDGHGGHGSQDGHRPRNLGVRESLFHLDADWGTSLAYILPLSLSFTGRLAPVYMLIIAFIMFVVANGYKIVCKYNPDGGGVYSSLKKVNTFLAVVGALLLITDYIVTEALSVSDSFHYLQLDMLFVHGGLLSFLPEMLKNPQVVTRVWTIGIIIFLAIINWRGPHFSAKFAAIASAPTFFLATVLAVMALPYVPAGLANIGHFDQSLLEVFRNTTGVLLALSGVEAISNMTGIMKDPEKTSKKAINIELLKVVFSTLVLGIAMNGMPKNVIYVGHGSEKDFVYETEEHTQLNIECVTARAQNFFSHTAYQCPVTTIKKARPDMLVAMGNYLFPGIIGTLYGFAMGLVYGLLLIFAGNTALIDITNVTYALAKDKELPQGFTKLNKKYGVPIWGLIMAGVAPILTVLFVGANVEALAALYAIGVVGAIALNLTGTMIQVQGKERIIAGIGAVLMSSLFVTLIFTKMEATLFASSVLFLGLTVRAIQKNLAKKKHNLPKQALSSEIPSGQILVPIFEEDQQFFEYAAGYAQQEEKELVLIFFHKNGLVFGSFIENTVQFFKKRKVTTYTLVAHTQTPAQTINQYREALDPEVTIVPCDKANGSEGRLLTHCCCGNILLYSQVENSEMDLQGEPNLNLLLEN
jgi:amino acid transporter